MEKGDKRVQNLVRQQAGHQRRVYESVGRNSQDIYTLPVTKDMFFSTAQVYTYIIEQLGEQQLS